MVRHCSSVRSMKACRPPPPIPALAKQPSTRLKLSRVAAIAALTEAGSLTSQMAVCTLPEQPAIVAAALLFFSGLRPQIETLHPAAASGCAMPRPMPPLPPVMTATRPVRSKIRVSVSIGFSILVWRALGRASTVGRCSIPTMDKLAQKIKYGFEIEALCTARRITRSQVMRKQMQFKHVTLDIDGPVAILKLDHQEVMNAVSIDMLGGLGEALDAIDDKKAEVRCLVITGAGRAFCTGANLQGRNNQKPGKSNAGAALETAFHPFLRRLRNLHCPIVTSVNGPAAGAGMSFALMGDMILCARSSYFLQAFRRMGLVPDCGSTWLLPRLIGRARSVELSLMGERLPAEKALEWGLVNRVHDDAALMQETMKLAHDLANGPTVALSLIRKLYWESPENSFADQLNLDFESQRIAGSAEDFKEGVTAFLEKRAAKFKGK